ncbi:MULTISPECIES: serine/threonine-protein kinase [unclassified Mycobacterium]|uniref:serine/threonine-protein kinase n=1 Tax=unclassified Mycobacterium TaxID=2642494 RepID=UPI0029C796A7|nr:MULTISPECIES: serine/threonine-protein kinase [unclassified Mycobacterium]
MESRVGTAFGKYNIISLLGKGGMGEVYEAYDTDKNRTVALKILADGLSNDATFRKRFQRESHAAAVLQEPHVIPIHDWGEIDGRLYIDMRLVRGHTLDELIAKGPLEPSRAVAIIGQIGAALDASHAEGLMHRDIKPHNIIVTQADFAYLVDFGIAETRGDTRLTTAGTPIGTFNYMAPERFSDKDATPAVDVYALACVLYEALTGDSPFARDSLENLVAAHLVSPPPQPSVTNARVPATFDAVIARGMAKDPDDRYGTAGGLVRAAQRAVDGGNQTLVMPLGAAPSDPAEVLADSYVGRQRRGWLLPSVIAVAAVLILGGVVIGLLAQQKGGPTPLPPQVTGSDQTADGEPPSRGVVLQQPSLEVRAEPVRTATVIGFLPYETDVFIVCTTIGDVVEGPGVGGGPSISTPVWNKVRTALDGADLGFVPDAWVDTGTAQPQARTC